MLCLAVCVCLLYVCVCVMMVVGRAKGIGMDERVLVGCWCSPGCTADRWVSRLEAVELGLEGRSEA